MWNGKALGAFKEVWLFLFHGASRARCCEIRSTLKRCWNVMACRFISLYRYIDLFDWGNRCSVQSNLSLSPVSIMGLGGGSHKCTHVAHRICKASKRGWKLFFEVTQLQDSLKSFQNKIPSLLFSFACLKSEDLQSTWHLVRRVTTLWPTPVKMHIFAIFSRLAG